MIYIYIAFAYVTRYRFIMIFGDKKNSVLPKIALVVKLKENVDIDDVKHDRYRYKLKS